MVGKREGAVMAVKVAEETIKKLETDQQTDQQTISEQSKIINVLKHFNKSLQDGYKQKQAIFAENNETCYENNQLKTKQLYTLSNLFKLQTLLIFIFIILIVWIFFGSDDKSDHNYNMI